MKNTRPCLPIEGERDTDKALTRAMNEWKKKKKEDVNVRALEMLEKGFDMGGLKTKDRNEWHERGRFQEDPRNKSH